MQQRTPVKHNFRKLMLIQNTEKDLDIFLISWSSPSSAIFSCEQVIHFIFALHCGTTVDFGFFWVLTFLSRCYLVTFPVLLLCPSQPISAPLSPTDISSDHNSSIGRIKQLSESRLVLIWSAPQQLWKALKPILAFPKHTSLSQQHVLWVVFFFLQFWQVDILEISIQLQL